MAQGSDQKVTKVVTICINNGKHASVSFHVRDRPKFVRMYGYHTGGRTMLYLTCICSMIPSVDLARYRVSRTKYLGMCGLCYTSLVLLLFSLVFLYFFFRNTDEYFLIINSATLILQLVAMDIERSKGCIYDRIIIYDGKIHFCYSTFVNVFIYWEIISGEHICGSVIGSGIKTNLVTFLRNRSTNLHKSIPKFQLNKSK